MKDYEYYTTQHNTTQHRLNFPSFVRLSKLLIFFIAFFTSLAGYSQSKVIGSFSSGYVALGQNQAFFEGVFHDWCDSAGQEFVSFNQAYIEDNDPFDTSQIANFILMGQCDSAGSTSFMTFALELEKNMIDSTYRVANGGVSNPKYCKKVENCSWCKGVRDGQGAIIGCNCIWVKDENEGDGVCDLHTMSNGATVTLCLFVGALFVLL